MLYDLIQIKHGKEVIMMTDVLTKVQDRKKQLSQSQRKMKVIYKIKPSTEVTVKYRKPPVFGFDPSGDADKVRLRRSKAKRTKTKAVKAKAKMASRDVVD